MNTVKTRRIVVGMITLGIGAVFASVSVADVERYKDEGLYLTRVAELQLDTIHEGYETTQWDAIRYPDGYAQSVVSQGLEWSAAAPQLWGGPGSAWLTSNNNWARTGQWGMFELHVGGGWFYPTTIRVSSPETMYGIGIWIKTNPGSVDTGFLFQDRSVANAPGYVLNGYGAMYPGDNAGFGHKFIGIVDPDGFNDVIITGTLEVNEKGFLEGGAIYGIDDAIIAVAPAPQCDGDTNGDQIVDVNDISYVLFRLGSVAPDGDANNDGAVDVNDISYVLFRLGDSCS